MGAAQFQLLGMARPQSGLNLERRILLGSAIGGAPLGAPVPDRPLCHDPLSPPDPASGSPARDGLPSTLHKVRGVHEGLSYPWPAARSPAGRGGRPLEPDPHPRDRILRILLHPLRPGLSHRGHREALFWKESKRSASAWPSSIGIGAFLTPRASSASSARSTAPLRRRRSGWRRDWIKDRGGRRRQVQAPEGRSRSLHRLRDLREAMPGAGLARHSSQQYRGVAQPQ